MNTRVFAKMIVTITWPVTNWQTYNDDTHTVFLKAVALHKEEGMILYDLPKTLLDNMPVLFYLTCKNAT